MAGDLGALKITALGVGHGDAILIQWTTDKDRGTWTCLVDGGESRKSLEQRLQAHGIETIDLLVLSHLDVDHAGGLVGLAGNVWIKSYWGPCLPAFERHSWLFGQRGADALERGRRLEESLTNEGVEILYPLEGFASSPMGPEGPVLHVLSPPARLISRLLFRNDILDLVDTFPTPLGWLVTSEDDDLTENSADLRQALARGWLGRQDIPDYLARSLPPGARAADLARDWGQRSGYEPEFFGDSLLNNTSLVLWIEARPGSRLNRVLLPGDQENWTYLFARHPRGLQAEVLKLSHHGGRVYLESDPAHDELFSMVRPEVALVSATGRHNLPRSAIRQAAIRWGSTVLCTSNRGREIISGFDEEEPKCCHDHFRCQGNEDVTIELAGSGIVGSKLACHTRLGGHPGPVIQIRQHIVEPSAVVHKLLEGELRTHIEWLRRKLVGIHQQRRSSALPDAQRSHPITLPELRLLAEVEKRGILGSQLSRVLEEGSNRGVLWANRGNSYKDDSWCAYARPSQEDSRQYQQILDQKELLLFPAATEPRSGDRESLILNLDPSGLALLAEEALTYPRETFRATLWPAVLRQLRGRDWHCFLLKGIGFGLTKRSGTSQELFRSLFEVFTSSSSGESLLPGSYSMRAHPILVSGSVKEEPFADYKCASIVRECFSLSTSNLKYEEIVRLEGLGISRDRWDNQNFFLGYPVRRVAGEDLGFVLSLLARQAELLW